MKLNGVQHYLWRAVNHEGDVLEAFVSKTRDRKAALKFLKKLMKRHGRQTEVVTYAHSVAAQLLLVPASAHGGVWGYRSSSVPPEAALPDP